MFFGEPAESAVSSAEQRFHFDVRFVDEALTEFRRLGEAIPRRVQKLYARGMPGLPFGMFKSSLVNRNHAAIHSLAERETINSWTKPSFSMASFERTNGYRSGWPMLLFTALTAIATSLHIADMRSNCSDVR